MPLWGKLWAFVHCQSLFLNFLPPQRKESQFYVKLTTSLLKYSESRIQGVQIHRGSIYFAFVVVTDKTLFDKNGVKRQDDEFLVGKVGE